VRPENKFGKVIKSDKVDSEEVDHKEDVGGIK
jgi:hypothetical protein